MAMPIDERLATLADPGQARRAARGGHAAPASPARACRAGFIQWGAIIVSKVALDKNRALRAGRSTQLAEKQGKHVADVMLDLAVEEELDTEFQLQSRPPEDDVELADYVQIGHALPSQSDAGAHLNTNFCTAGESSYVLGEWVRERELLSLEDAIRRYTFQPARIMGLRDRGLIREGMAADLMVFDLARIGVTDDEVTHDGPAARLGGCRARRA